MLQLAGLIRMNRYLLGFPIVDACRTVKFCALAQAPEYTRVSLNCSFYLGPYKLEVKSFLVYLRGHELPAGLIGRQFKDLLLCCRSSG